MTTAKHARWLQAGIAAVKAGERDKARALLTQLLQIDERNEQAWLWLSGVVNTDDERRQCLENVLAINPDNEPARRGLTRLGVKQPTGGREEVIVRQEIEPPSLAAAILYPERHTKEWRTDKPAISKKKPDVVYVSGSSFHDVWASEVDICAFCAHEVRPEDDRCPGCRRRLAAEHYRYPRPTVDTYIFWVLLLGLGQIFLIQLLYNIIISHHLAATFWPASMMVAMFVVAFGVYFRRGWAYTSAILLLSLILLVGVFAWLLPADSSTLGMDNLDPAIGKIVHAAMSGLGGFLQFFQMGAAVLAMYFGIFKAGPDFEKVTTRQLAAVTKGLREGSDYHVVARRLAHAGLWASAVLHWQRAAAKDPNQPIYQRHLAQGYAHLGFYDRSLNVLESARRLPASPEMQAEIEQIVNMVKQAKQTQENAGTRISHGK
ncbi:MAG: hypothetical protein ACE5E7_17550 [Anaerolineae bacterium]